MVKSESPKQHMQAAPGARGQTFAQLMRAARIKHGLTQRELAERLGGMRQPKVAMLESGERHPPRSAAFYAQLREVFDGFEVDAIVDSILAELPWGPVGVATGHLVAAVAHWAVGLVYVCRLSGLERGPLFAQSVRAMILVIIPAGVLARVGAGVPAGALVQLLCGVGLGLAWAAIVALVLPAVRRDVAPVASVVLTAARRSRALAAD